MSTAVPAWRVCAPIVLFSMVLTQLGSSGCTKSATSGDEAAPAAAAPARHSPEPAAAVAVEPAGTPQKAEQPSAPSLAVADRDAAGPTAAKTGVNKSETAPPPPRWKDRKGPRRVLILGDSLAATGFGVMLEHKLDKHAKIDVDRRGKSSSGLARPDFFDWMVESRKQIKLHDPDLVVVIIGGNDGQDLITTQKGGPRSAWETPAWRTTYLERMAEFLSYLSADNRRVLWLGLPQTDTKNFEAKMRIIRSVQMDALKKLARRGRYLDTTPLLSDDSGMLLREVPAGRRTKPLRDSDGVHFTMAGSQYFADQVYPEVLADLEL